MAGETNDERYLRSLGTIETAMRLIVERLDERKAQEDGNRERLDRMLAGMGLLSALLREINIRLAEVQNAVSPPTTLPAPR